MFRESSSVIRAPYSFGYKDVGGLNPSSLAYCGGSIGKVCERKRSPLQDNATFYGKLAKAVRLAVSNQREVLGRREFKSSTSHQFYGMSDFTVTQEITVM